ncbi:hypothetical protein OG762_51610 (plasmid) [Streptomyces sp. NBC_01136]|uniref:hypothetical protein n=1 Tax=Streptomyces sp. NBC_01136 TaxID=2903754 RepID=UPI002F910976|nr:hypothetical protein OG762_51610 [Streptomyces sp. NBC_01136]
MKLTAAQTAALRLVLDSPDRIAARVETPTEADRVNFRRLHHRTEARLVELGLVEVNTVTATDRDTSGMTTEYEIPALRLTTAGYEALGVEAPAADAEPMPPAAEDEIALPLPKRFRTAYEAELGDVHRDTESATYRRVWDHVMNNRPTAPRWLLGHLADVAGFLADLVEATRETAPATRAARRLGCVELLALLHHHGAHPWPVTGHAVRPWGEEPAHCDDCAARVGPRPPADVITAETAVNQDRAERQAAYETRLAEELRAAEDEIAAEYGEHMRRGAAVLYTHPRTGETTVGVVESVYRDANGKAAADVNLIGHGSAGVLADELGPLPELPDMGERVEGQWLITDKAGATLAHVPGETREQALAAARRIPAVREAEARDGGLASRPLWTADLSPAS